jgi:hypothetical protein
MKRIILHELLRALESLSNVSREEYYFLMASVVMYFQSPLKDESWNTFPAQLEAGKWPVSDALLLTDEEKNPHFWTDARIPKRVKEAASQMLFEQLLRFRKRLAKTYPYPHSALPSVVTVPNSPLRADEPPAVFPTQYLHEQFKTGKYVNELTGDPLSWTFVEQVKQVKPTMPPSSTRGPNRRIPTEKFMEDVTRELRVLQFNRGHCQICRAKSTRFKSVWKYQTVEFCSLDCLRKWGMN